MHTITEKQIRDALNNYRTRKPASQHPLLHLQFVQHGLPEGATDTLEARRDVFQQIARDLAWRMVLRTAGPNDGVVMPDEHDSPAARALVKRAAESGNKPFLQAALYCYYYFTAGRMNQAQIATQLVGLPVHAVQDALRAAWATFADALRSLEAEAWASGPATALTYVPGSTPAPSGAPDIAQAAANLPFPVTAFIGREVELDHLRRVLATKRLVSLIGPGGIGKTRLAIALALDSLKHGIDAVWWVDLADVPPDHPIQDAIAASLGLDPATGDEVPDKVSERVLEIVRCGEVLVVLDNLERHAEHAEYVEYVDSLLKRSPSLHILTTSRRSLDLYGEHEEIIEPLSVPRPAPKPSARSIARSGAVQLFIARAQDKQPTFTLDDANAPVIAEICRRLDGLPLAIELAAAKLRTMDPQEILDRLERRLPVLVGGPIGLADRHKTMRAAIAWSVEDMAEDEILAFRRLSVLVGTFDAADAEGCGLADAATLRALCDESLLSPVSDRAGVERFRMLEVTRDHASELLVEAQEDAATRRRHALHFATIAEQHGPRLREPGRTESFGALVGSDGNMRAAFAWSVDSGHPELVTRLAAAMWRYWHLRGIVVQADVWLQTALSAADELDAISPETLGSILTGAGTVARDLHDFERAEALYLRCLALDEAAGDEERVAGTLNNLGTVAMFSGRLETARQLCQQSLARWKTLDSPRGTAGPLNNLGQIALREGDLDAALEAFLGAGREYLKADDDWGIALAHVNTALAFHRAGRFYEAAEPLIGALEKFAGIPDEDGLATVFIQLAWLLAAIDRPAPAAMIGAHALALVRAIGTPFEEEDREEHARFEATVQAALGPALFESARRQGESMPIEEAIAEAKGLLRQVAGSIES